MFGWLRRLFAPRRPTPHLYGAGVQGAGIITNGAIRGITAYDNNSGNNTALTAPTYAINVAGTTQYLRVGDNTIYNETARSETMQNGIIVASTALDVEIYGNRLPYLSGATAFTDGTGGALRIQYWGNRDVGANSDGVMIARGMRVNTKSGGGLNDTLRLYEPGSSKQMYLRCNSSGDLELVNSGFSQNIGGIDQFGHTIHKQGAVPTYAAGTGAGTTPTVSAMTGTDTAMVATLTTGATPTAGATIVTVTFANAYATAPNVVDVQPMSSAAAALSGAQLPYVVSITTTGFVLKAGTTALPAATAFVWGFTPSV
jgi:hypothetical protein